jgi:hypothetical protein
MNRETGHIDDDLPSSSGGPCFAWVSRMGDLTAVRFLVN